MSARFVLAFAIACVACGSATKPEDIKLAASVCAERGGWTYVSRSEMGKQFVIFCKDDTRFEVRFTEPLKP